MVEPIKTEETMKGHKIKESLIEFLPLWKHRRNHTKPRNRPNHTWKSYTIQDSIKKPCNWGIDFREYQSSVDLEIKQYQIQPTHTKNVIFYKPGETKIVAKSNYRTRSSVNSDTTLLSTDICKTHVQIAKIRKQKMNNRYGNRRNQNQEAKLDETKIDS